MAGTFPSLSSGEVCMYPLVRTVAVATRILRFENDTEQRFRTSPILNHWELSYTRLKLADVNTLRTFFETQKGAFDTTWVFPFEGANYTAMCFDQDEFTAVENRPRQYDLTLRCRATKQSGTYSSSVPATYPTINGGVITQRPFHSGTRFLTTRNDSPAGLRYSRHERDDGLRYWTCSYPAASDTDAGTLMDFYTSMGGRLVKFAFTDPDTSVTYDYCRFANENFERRFLGKNHSAIALQIEQIAQN